MPILDRFRRRPQWEDPDPLVRASAVRQFAADQAELIATVARTDEDPRVRRAAVKRLHDAAVLAEVAQTDGDAAVQEAALEGLRDHVIATQDAAAGSSALAVLSDTRDLVAIAREARLAALRESALGRLSDPKSLVSVAKSALEATTRLAALEALADRTLYVEIALKSEHKDVALAALERVEDEEALRAVSTRARHKAVGRQARARLGALTRDPETSEPPQVQDVAEEQARYERIRAEQQREAEQRDGAFEARVALCERVEALGGPDIEPGLEQAEREWTALSQESASQIPSLDERFHKASETCRSRLEEWRGLRERLPRFEEVCRELEALAEAQATPGPQVTELERRFTELEADGPASEELRERFSTALAQIAGRRAAHREERAQLQRENLARLEKLCERVEAQAGAKELTLRAAEQSHRAVRAALADLGSLPSKKDHDHVQERLKSARAALFPKLQELREADEWSRWANVAVQERLCQQTEALMESEDIERVAQELRQIDQDWKQARQVPKDEAEALWTRFRSAREQLRTRCDAHFARQSEEQAANLERKQALCEQAEGLADSSDWVKTAQALKQLQAEWKSIGPVPRRQSDAVWRRFRRACDTFFTRRKTDLSQRKEQWAANLERKEALCVQAEGLVESNDWEVAAAALKRLQAEWKTIGPVRKNRSEAVWRRFRGACDAYFERYKNRDELAREANRAAHEGLCQELEGLAGDDGAPPDDLATRVAEILARSRSAGAAPRGDARTFGERLEAARDRVIESYPESFRGTELDPEQNRARREKLCARIEGLELPSMPAASGTTDVETLRDRLREALATNTLGGRGAIEERWKTAMEEISSARTAWKRLGPVPGEAGRALAERFDRACRRVTENRPRA